MSCSLEQLKEQLIAAVKNEARSKVEYEVEVHLGQCGAHHASNLGYKWAQAVETRVTLELEWQQRTGHGISLLQAS